MFSTQQPFLRGIIGKEFSLNVKIELNGNFCDILRPLRLALYGDLGNVNAMSLPMIQRKAEEGVYQAVLHVGDMAYNMFEHNGRVGDAFMEQVSLLIGFCLPLR